MVQEELREFCEKHGKPMIEDDNEPDMNNVFYNDDRLDQLMDDNDDQLLVDNNDDMIMENEMEDQEAFV